MKRRGSVSLWMYLEAIPEVYASSLSLKYKTTGDGGRTIPPPAAIGGTAALADHDRLVRTTTGAKGVSFMVPVSGRLAIAAVAILALAAPFTSAFAGSNGQQIELYEQTNVSSACLSGTNQNGTSVYVCFSAPAPQYNISQFPNYWWKGYTSIDNYVGGSFIGTSYCTVPTSYYLDYWTCSSV